MGTSLSVLCLCARDLLLLLRSVTTDICNGESCALSLDSSFKFVASAAGISVRADAAAGRFFWATFSLLTSSWG